MLHQQFLPLLTLVLVSAAPFSDTPYNEVISSRFTCNDGSYAPPSWGTTPFSTAPTQVLGFKFYKIHAVMLCEVMLNHSAVQVEAVLNPDPGFVVVVEDGVWLISLPQTRTPNTPGMTGNNATMWLYPAEWMELVGLSVTATVNRVVTDSTRFARQLTDVFFPLNVIPSVPLLGLIV